MNDLKHFKVLHEFLKQWGSGTIYRHIADIDIPVLLIKEGEGDDDYEREGLYQTYELLVMEGVILFKHNEQRTLCDKTKTFYCFEVSPEYKEALLIYYI